jgi:hypothetical protein
MPGPSASYSAAGPRATRAVLFGLAVVALLLGLLAGPAGGPAPAGAATLEPCPANGGGGPSVEIDGDLKLPPLSATRKAWRRAGIRQKLVKPANNLTGRPTFPVKAVTYGSVPRVELKGKIKILRKRRSVSVSRLKVISAAGKPAWLRARIGNKTVNLFKVKGGKRTFDREDGELSRVGKARLTGAGARILNRRLGTGKKRKLRAGLLWGYFNLYALYKVTNSDEPTVETPEVPPVKVEPAGAATVGSAATIKWFVRQSFIDYVASGEGTRVEEGAIADPPAGSNDLSYSFNFPFVSGWTVPAASGTPENTVVKGGGLVGFRFCAHGINFTVSNPEVEIGDDTSSRLIFEVSGTDNSELPEQRAVVTKLLPSQAESHSVTDNPDGSRTVTYEKIPGIVPVDGAGIFADFYLPNDPFGHFTISYTYEPDSP